MSLTFTGPVYLLTSGRANGQFHKGAAEFYWSIVWSGVGTHGHLIAGPLCV